MKISSTRVVRSWRRVSAAFLGMTVATACSTTKLPDIASIYKDAALNEIRNPVVVIHGILGARLVDRSNGRSMWGAFTRDAYDPNTVDGARAMALPLQIPASALDYDPQQERFYADGPLDRLRVGILFNIVEVQVYAQIIRTLVLGGYSDPVGVQRLTPRYNDDHFTCFTFFYDWRRDNIANAVEFGRWLQRTRADIARRATMKIDRLRRSDKDQDRRHAEELDAWLKRGFKFDIVAHSMGGLIARYYLRFGAADLPKGDPPPKVTWAGAKDIDRLIIVGTPNLGSMFANEHLLSGFRPSFVLPHFHQAVLGTMPSIYQLMPRSRHQVAVDAVNQPLAVDFFDPEVWRENGWGLMHPSSDRYLEWLLPEVDNKAARRQRAFDYLAWCLARAAKFHAALDQRAASRCPVPLYLFAGDSEDTKIKTRLLRRQDRLDARFLGDAELVGPGDGTVARYSAVGDERAGSPFVAGLRTNIDWKNKTFLTDDHIGLTRNPAFSNNVLHILLEELRTD